MNQLRLFSGLDLGTEPDPRTLEAVAQPVGRSSDESIQAARDLLAKAGVTRHRVEDGRVVYPVDEQPF